MQTQICPSRVLHLSQAPLPEHKRSILQDPSDSSFRRYLHELLKEVYPYYDIVIWSATSMRWIEIKLRELGISNNPEYKISMLMDGTCMVAVNSSRKGTPNSASFGARPPTS